MKKIILIASALLFTFTSCDVKDEVENVINNNIPAVEQTVTEDFTIDAVNLDVAGPVKETITIDTTAINEKIDDATSNDSVKIEEITLDDLEIKLAEGSEQTNFDFLDSLSLTISSGVDSAPIVIDFGTIEKGLDTLSLPEGAGTSILSLIEGSDVGELTIDLDLVTNTAVENDLNLELISTLLAEIGIEI